VGEENEKGNTVQKKSVILITFKPSLCGRGQVEGILMSSNFTLTSKKA
jgi:hypothetical protein